MVDGLPTGISNTLNFDFRGLFREHGLRMDLLEQWHPIDLNRHNCWCRQEVSDQENSGSSEDLDWSSPLD